MISEIQQASQTMKTYLNKQVTQEVGKVRNRSLGNSNQGKHKVSNHDFTLSFIPESTAVVKVLVSSICSVGLALIGHVAKRSDLVITVMVTRAVSETILPAV